MKSHSLRRGTGILAVLASFAVGDARAQDTNANVVPAATPAITSGPAAEGNAPGSAQGNTSGSLERIIVTGSNIPTAEATASQPLQTINRAGIDVTGGQTISQVLQQAIPQVIGSGNYRGDQVNNPGGGEANVALRGLPAQDTLTLVNGRRMPRTSTPSISSLAFNINDIPLGAVQRIDILREGASPIYGSDAVAGVVNIILRDDYEGTSISGQFGITDKGDGETYQTDFVTGYKNDRLNLVATGSWYSQNGIKSTDRDYLSTANRYGEANAGYDQRSSANSPGRLFPASLDTSIRLNNGVIFGPGTTLADYRPFNGAATANDRYDFNKVLPITLDTDRYGFTVNTVYKITDNLRFRFEGLYNRTNSESVAAPTPIFTDQEAPATINGQSVGLQLPATNRYNQQIFGADAASLDFYYRTIELGNRVTDTDIDTYRAYGGFEGELLDNRLRWSVGGLYARESSQDYEDNLVNKRALVAQLANTNPNVISWNPLADYNFNRLPAQRAATESLRLNATNKGDSDIFEFSGQGNGDVVQLPAGFITIALGGAYRQESLDKQPDPNIAAFNTIGTVNQLATVGYRAVTSGYGEIYVPFVSPDMKIPLVYSFDGRAAARIEDYSDFGTTVKPGATLRYQPFQELTFRANYAEGFTAPPLQYLYQGASESFDSISNQRDPTQIQARSLRVGNPNLRPTNSKSFDLGVVWTPSFIPKELGTLTLRADYFYIQKSGDINIPSTQQVVDLFFAGNAAYQNAVDITPGGTITAVRVAYSNFDVLTRIRGIDYGVNYELPFKGGEFGTANFSADFTYLWKFNDQYGQEAGLDRFGGLSYSGASGGSGALPRNRGVFTLGYKYKSFQIVGTCNYVGPYKEFNGFDAVYLGENVLRTVHDYTTFDLQTSYTFTGHQEEVVTGNGKAVVDGKGKAVAPEERKVEKLAWWHDTTITFGVLNVGDERAPLVSNINGNYDANLTNPVGRFFYVRAEKKF